ncbi:glycoside hydrolase family 16 protein [Mycena maculata]|uniref:Glycoside hydrolase family 16 protein n=1 Tax=Mycena maculata TaxID=230809 RepID=A0AAD7NZG0_9AGAR|nr:glycoside hydrolase family 16 protein [Mycena maculata]
MRRWHCKIYPDSLRYNGLCSTIVFQVFPLSLCVPVPFSLLPPPPSAIMPAFSALVLLALPLVALAAPHSQTHRHARRESLDARTTYTLKDHYTGNDFLDWNFFSASDPTNGNVNYLTKSQATSKGLAYVQADGTTILAVDSTSKLASGTNRNSVRISSPNSYSTGLFIADMWAMPHGPTVWPAFWAVGPNWPAGGEIDILEGVGDSTTNQMTLHTSSGCTFDTNDLSAFSGAHTSTTNCLSGATSNNGCGVTDSSANVYGHNFNMVAGGVYATLVEDSGISIWHFQRSAIPSDITAKTPNPSNWGKPAAFFSSSTCNIADHFSDMVLTFDTTLCGDWAGSAFDGGESACVAAVADPSNYKNAKWELNYVSVYQ